jgi:hypothetical protein
VMLLWSAICLPPLTISSFSNAIHPSKASEDPANPRGHATCLKVNSWPWHVEPSTMPTLGDMEFHYLYFSWP